MRRFVSALRNNYVVNSDAGKWGKYRICRRSVPQRN